MGFLDGILGRRAPVGPDLDALFALPSAAITLQASLDFVPTGRGSVAFRAPEGRAFADVEADVRALLDADGGPPVELASDGFGFTWLVVRTEPADLPAAVTDVHAVNTALVGAGFGPQLLCSLASFRGPGDRVLAMVYLFKRGTFYPFAPQDGVDEEARRDSILELQVRDLLVREMPLEADTSRWFPVWSAPGL
ncbi:MAG: hypothetical protein Q8M17_02580 [Actinomycetota bacterium]|nr:hypothetical protein [Actinomycetota bacterium]